MAIITQASLTSLRSLKYGNDQPGGGNSGEPYVVQTIPPPDKQQVDSTNIWRSDNGLIRGGFLGATRASFLDTKRIGKFLLDAPRGPLFIAKQVGLQLSNPQLETKKLSLGNTGILGAIVNVANKITNTVGPTRIYNLGINTLAQVPVTAFGGHITRHGFLPFIDEDQKYANVVYSNDASSDGGSGNRLVQLKSKLEKDFNANIAHYVSGPGSVDGIGSTTIKRYVHTLNNSQFRGYDTITAKQSLNTVGPLTSASIPFSLSTKFTRPTPKVDYLLAQGASIQYFGEKNVTLGEGVDQNVINYSPSGKKYNVLKAAIETQNSGSRLGRSVRSLTTDLSEGNSDLTENLTGPVSFVYTGKSKYKGLPLSKYNIETRLGLENNQDQINLTPLYINEAPPGTSVIINKKKFNVRDLIKFRIEAVDNDKPSSSVWMIFRAYLTGITDDPNPQWNNVNYVGRGEPFYIYKGFERNVSFSFQVAALSEAELEPMWQKLNYLYSNTMPDYSNGIMRGPYMKLTLGNYLYRQPGIIRGLSYTIDDKSPWEIAIDDPDIPGGSPLYELPHVMNVKMTFAPIHDFLPRKFPSEFDNDWKNLPAFVADRPEVNQKWLTDIFPDKKQIPIGTR